MTRQALNRKGLPSLLMQSSPFGAHPAGGHNLLCATSVHSLPKPGPAWGTSRWAFSATRGGCLCWGYSLDLMDLPNPGALDPAKHPGPHMQEASPNSPAIPMDLIPRPELRRLLACRLCFLLPTQRSTFWATWTLSGFAEGTRGRITLGQQCHPLGGPAPSLGVNFEAWKV